MKAAEIACICALIHVRSHTQVLTNSVQSSNKGGWVKGGGGCW